MHYMIRVLDINLVHNRFAIITATVSAEGSGKANRYMTMFEVGTDATDMVAIQELQRRYSDYATVVDARTDISG